MTLRLRAFRLLALSAATFACACSSSSTADTPDAAPPGEVNLSGLTATHSSSIMRLTFTLKNTTTKNIKSIDAIEIDPGDGAHRASPLRACADGSDSPWLLKAGANASITLSVRANGKDRQVVEAQCLEGGKPSTSNTALWEFQDFEKLDTNGTDPVQLGMNGSHADDSLWATQNVKSN